MTFGIIQPCAYNGNGDLTDLTGTGTGKSSAAPRIVGIRMDAAMISRHEDHRVVETPQLNIRYDSYAEMPLRPRGERPSGPCLDPAAPDLPA